MPVSPRAPCICSPAALRVEPAVSRLPPRLVLRRYLCGSSMWRNGSWLPKMVGLSAHTHLTLRRENVKRGLKKTLFWLVCKVSELFSFDSYSVKKKLNKKGPLKQIDRLIMPETWPIPHQRTVSVSSCFSFPLVPH